MPQAIVFAEIKNAEYRRQNVTALFLLIETQTRNKNQDIDSYLTNSGTSVLINVFG